MFKLYKIGIFIALHTPLRIAYAISVFISTIFRLFSKRDRIAVKENLRVIFPGYDEKTIDHTAKKIFHNFGKYLVDFFRFSIIDKDYINKYIKVNGVEHLEEALSLNKGAILASAHLGNWELGAAVVAGLGFPIDVVALNHDDEEINNFFISQRKSQGVGVIPVGMAVRRCFKALSENRSIALVSDRDYYDNGLKLEFFGKKTIIPKGPALFSRRCGSPIVPVLMVRNTDDTFTLNIRKPIIVEHTEDEYADLMRTTAKIVKVLEEEILQYPSQWYVFRRFWEKLGWGKNNK